eukprot:jgi/Chlat1/38/ChrspC234687S00919
MAPALVLAQGASHLLAQGAQAVGLVLGVMIVREQLMPPQSLSCPCLLLLLHRVLGGASVTVGPVALVAKVRVVRSASSARGGPTAPPPPLPAAAAAAAQAPHRAEPAGEEAQPCQSHSNYQRTAGDVCARRSLTERCKLVRKDNQANTADILGLWWYGGVWR